MTIEQIMEAQRLLRRSRKSLPELKGKVREACLAWAETSRKYGVIPLSSTFSLGR